MIEDLIVEDVRRIRQANAAKFNYDVRAIAEDARKREKAGRHRIVDLQATRKQRKSAREAK